MGTYFPAHDLFAVTSPDPIHDRSHEHMGTTNVAIATAQRVSLDGVKEIDAGRELPLVVRDEADDVFNDIIVTGDFLSADMDRREYRSQLVTKGGFHAMKV